MISVLRLKHRALSTEKAYLGWLRSFYRFVNGVSPHELDSNHVKDFLSNLAVERNVAPSTQSQAFNAIFLLFRYVLDKDLGNIEGSVRAYKKTAAAGGFDATRGFMIYTHVAPKNKLGVKSPLD